MFLICILIKQQKHVAKTTLFNHRFYETNFKPKLFTAKVECNGIVLKGPLKYLLMPLLGKNQFAIALHMCAVCFNWTKFGQQQ